MDSDLLKLNQLKVRRGNWRREETQWKKNHSKEIAPGGILWDGKAEGKGRCRFVRTSAVKATFCPLVPEEETPIWPEPNP